MMTSVGSERPRGTREKTQIPAAQPTQPQKPVVQATAEQIRLAQMIYDKNDADFEDKVKQLMEVTGKNQDDCIVALHDCNGDVNRAINLLLEGSSDTTSWETVGGKKKSLGKESSENKENREKRGDREVSRGRGTSSRRGRGGSRGREFRVEENGVETPPGDRPSDRGKRGKGRGFGRARGRGTGRFSAQGMGTFNPADYTDSSATDGFGAKQESWELGENDAAEGTGAWKNSIEEWTAEDWNEDLSETKVFTASSVPAENHVASGQSIDLVTLLQNPGAPNQDPEAAPSFDATQQQGFGQALVFTNSQHNPPTASGTSNPSTVNTYSAQSLTSVLSSGFRELSSSKLANSTGSQILEPLKSPGLGQFASQGPLSTASPVSTTPTSSWDVKSSTSQPSILSHFDFKSQPEPSPVLSQLTQRQQQPPPPSAATVPPPGLEYFASQKAREPLPVDSCAAGNKTGPLSSLSPENPGVPAHQTQQKQIKPSKRRTPPVSKIPSSAVEMPGSTDVSGLNVQFGALEFGLEPAVSEFGPASSYESSPAPNNTLYTKPVNEPLNTSLPMSNTVQESAYVTPVVTASLTCSLQSTSLVPASSSSSSSYDQASAHNRVTYQSSVPPSEPASVAVMNGHNGVRMQPALDTASSVPTSKLETSPPSLPAQGPSLPSTTASTSLLLPSAPSHTAALPSSDLANSSLSQLSSSLSDHPSSLSSASSHTHNSVENANPALPPSNTFSVAATLATTSAATSLASTTHSLGLNATSVSLPIPTSRAAAPLASSAKAPPNLHQGVPPLLHNQYFVGPGGLLPAYPIYGYDDLQMLQSRLPVDYYGITFPAPANLTGRDGALATNPYSGDITKFGRGDSASPAPATTLAQAQQNQTQAHHTAQQAFLNPALPPGYSYTGLPYYAGVPGVPNAFQYGPTMFVPPASAKQHSMTLNAASTPFQQAGSYGQHSYGAGYDDLTQGTVAGDYSKGPYVAASQTQNKSAGGGAGKGVSVNSSNTGVPDISGSVYNKAQTFDKQGFHAGTPPPFNLPSALSSTGPLNPGAAPGYAPAPFLHILPAHQQPHSQVLHHHLQQDGQGGSAQRNQPSALQQKPQATKTTYGTSPYWTN
ncbi:ubiquitin-associated protein 2 [Ahaetulla prasina]|uniref:ubiquitin-associated protein 2 n=1 Tax=Ahaetulla prasina TaxID=499056 RepID=UPI00264A3841|nr:ubiquitin-associated protein 2 [Ahaetulla prasina]